MQAFEAGPFAHRTPQATEVPFSLFLGGTVVRGRIDAVFEESDGRALAGAADRGQAFLVVDWKTSNAAADALQLAVYRILQEALTNALRHGDGKAVEVRLAWHPERVEIEVRNAVVAGTESRPAGHGLVGMRLDATVQAQPRQRDDGSDTAEPATVLRISEDNARVLFLLLKQQLAEFDKKKPKSRF